MTAKVVDLNDYTMEKSIGVGGYGRVNLCIHNKTKREYAAKISKVCNPDNGDLIKECQREIEVLASVEHPCIIKLEGYSNKDFSDQNYTVILTKYMKDGSLMDMLRNESIGSPHAHWNNTKKQINLLGIACGMQFLHQKLIIHRDLKPGNVLLDGNLYPQIIDFGMSKILDPTKSIQMSVYNGTLSYMAPEMFNEENYNLPVDVYAFAITVFELISGGAAYPDGLIFNKINLIIDGSRPKFTEKIPPAFQKFISRCWDTNPSFRYTFDEIVDILLTDKTLMLPNVNLDEYNEYRKKMIKARPVKAPGNEQKSRKTFNAPKTPLNSRSNDIFSKTTNESTSVKTDRSSVGGIKNVSIHVPKARAKIAKIKDEHVEEHREKDMVEVKNRSEHKKVDHTKETDTTPASDTQKTKAFQVRVPKKPTPRPVFAQSQKEDGIDEKEESSETTEPAPKPQSSSDSENKDDEDDEDEGIKQQLESFSKSLSPGAYKMLTDPTSLMKELSTSMKMNMFNESFASDTLIKTMSSIPTCPLDALTTSISGKSKIKKIYENPDPKLGADMLLSIGNAYETGSTGSGINFTKAALFYKASADLGNSSAMLNYANFLRDGVGVSKPDPINAAQYMKKAAEAGLVEAYIGYGTMLKEEEGIENDIARSYYWLSKALEGGSDSVAAYRIIGEILVEGCDKVPQDVEKGLEYLKKASDKESLKASEYLMLYFIRNDQLSQAVPYIKIIADIGSDLIQFIYAIIFFEGMDDIPIDYNTAVKYFEMSAYKDNPLSMLFLGITFMDGRGNEQNLEKGAEWIRKSAKKDFIPAITRWGICLFEGEGVEQNKIEGQKFLKDAMERGSIEAKLYLIVHFFRGELEGDDFQFNLIDFILILAIIGIQE